MSPPVLTRVALGQCAVEIECHVDALAPHLAFLLGDTRTTGGEVQTRFVVDSNSASQFEVFRGDKRCYQTSRAGDLCTYLVGEIIFHLIENNTQELLIHAACLKRNGTGILLPGVSGSGKSTLSAWLLSRGFDYLTDELICVDPESFAVEAFTRPLNIKRPGMEAVQRAFGESFGDGDTLEGGISFLVPHRLFGDRYAGSRTQVHVVVFPRYSSSADFSLEPLSTAKTALLLMQTFVNARNHAEHGFHDLTAFARTLSGFELHYSDFSQLDELERVLTDFDAGRPATRRPADAPG